MQPVLSLEDCRQMYSDAARACIGGESAKDFNRMDRMIRGLAKLSRWDKKSRSKKSRNAARVKTNCSPEKTPILVTAATATDAATLAPIITYSANRVDQFPLGMTRIAVSASNDAGNVGYAMFNVVVQDTPPAIDLWMAMRIKRPVGTFDPHAFRTNPPALSCTFLLAFAKLMPFVAINARNARFLRIPGSGALRAASNLHGNNGRITSAYLMDSPAMIDDNLKQRLLVLRGTLRNACTLDGAGRMVLTLVVCVLAGVLLDYCFFRWSSPVNTGFRVLMLGASLGALGTIFYKRVLGPLAVPLSVDDMALSVEREFPQLNDNLISAIQLTRIMADDRSVSTPMIEEVARQAHQHTAALDFSKVVKFERLKPVLYSAAGALLVFCLIFALMRPFMSVALLRFVNPFSNHPYPVRTFITVPEHDDVVVVPRNDGHRIVARITGALPSSAEIQFDHGKGWGKREPITTVKTIIDPNTGMSSKEFEYEYNPVISDFKFVIFAGDNQSEPRSVRCVDRPELNNMQVAYELPSYISDKKGEWKHERTLRNVVGTKATVQGEVNKPLKSAAIKIGDDAAHEMQLSLDRKTFIETVLLDSSKDYEIFLLDQDGLDNQRNKIRHKILAIPDALPKIAWKLPAADLDVTPTGVVALSLGLEDDWGLQKAGIKYKRFKSFAPAAAAGNQVVGAQNQPPPQLDANSQPVAGGFDLPEPQPDAFNRSAQKLDITKDWALGDMGLEAGDVVEYWAEAYDWCPTPRKGPEAQIYHLRILSPEDLKHRLDMERLRLVDDLKVIIRDQESDKKQIDAMKQHLDFGNSFEATDRGKVSEAGALQEEIRRKTQNLQNAFLNLIGRYKSNGLDTPEDTDRLQNMADVLSIEHATKMPEASQRISASAMAKLDPERIQHLAGASAKQDEILTDLKALLEQMQKWAETEELLRMTRELLLKQRNVTRLTSEFKERLGSKKPGDATKEEQGQVKGLEHEQRDCVTDMNSLYERMLKARAKMEGLDKFVFKNIDDSIKIAQNTDATPENPDLAATGDHFPSIADKMTAAQSDIRGDTAGFGFGAANDKQKAGETALERIITVLSRRREPDQKLIQDAKEARAELQKILEQQRTLTKQTSNIMNKQDLEQSIAQAKQRLQEIRKNQQELMGQTQNMQNAPDPEAGKLEQDLADARRDLDKLIADENKILKDTADALSPIELELIKAIHELAALEAEERGLAAESSGLSGDKIENLLRQHYGRIKELRARQEDLRTRTTTADALPDKAKLKELNATQSKLETETSTALAQLQSAGEQLEKSIVKDSPGAAAVQAAARALQQAASLALHAPDEMKAAGTQMSDAHGKDAVLAESNAMEKLGHAEEVLLKALGLEHKQFEDASVDLANRQANTRGKLDDLTNGIATLMRAPPEQLAKDPKLAAAAKAAAKAMPDLEGGSTGMGDAADTLRLGAPKGDRESSKKSAAIQNGSADKLASARAALQGATDELAKDKQAVHGANGTQQGQLQSGAKTLQERIQQLAGAIEKAHNTASGVLAPKAAQSASAGAAAAGKVGEAAAHMGTAKTDLGKPDPANATKNESKAIDALEDAKSKLSDLQHKVEELKTPSRRLERMQQALKDDARKLAEEVKNLEEQMPPSPTETKPADNIKNASNNMQNAQNSLSGSDSKGGENSKPGDGSKGGDKPKGKSGDQPKDNESPKGGEQGGPDSKEASKEQDHAISELDKAIKALDDLAAKAKNEPEQRVNAALKRLEEKQKTVRDKLLTLQPKIDQLKDKSGSPKAEKASQAAQSAAKNQSAASSQMSQGNQSGAKSSEQEAEQDLQEALDNLDQFQKQMQQQNRNEQLFQIEQELKKMLGVQKELLEKTQNIDKQRPAAPEKLPRRLIAAVQQTSGDQLQLAGATRVIVKKLEDSPVFQWVLQTATDDMAESGNRLDKQDSGPMTQEIQDDVIRKVGELIEALRKERTKPQQGGGGGGGGGGKQPLVPPLAELKMLQIMQRYVNTSTKKIDEEVIKAKAGQQDLSKDQKDRLRRNAVKEGDIARITTKIAQDLNSSGPPAPSLGPPPAPDGGGNGN